MNLSPLLLAPVGWPSSYQFLPISTAASHLQCLARAPANLSAESPPLNRAALTASLQIPAGKHKPVSLSCLLFLSQVGQPHRLNAGE